MLSDWFQDPEKQLLRCWFRLWVWLYPDLQRIEDEDDRMWALLFAEVSLSKSKRRLTFFLGFFLFPLIGGAVGMLLAVYLRPPVDWAIAVSFAGSMAGAAVFFGLDGLLMRRKVREAMRELGYEVCPGCGYDLRGVSSSCPKCGWRRERAS